LGAPIKVTFLFAFIFFHGSQFFLDLLGFSPSGRCAKNVKGRKMRALMEKINYRKQELDLVDRLLRIIESDATSSVSSRCSGRITDPATERQLRLLGRLGIRPLWEATRLEAEELIVHYQAVLSSARQGL